MDSEPDPLGTDQGLAQQQPNPPIYSGDSGIMDPGRYSDAFNGRWCSDTGAIIPCDHAYSLLSSGSADEGVAGSAWTRTRITNPATGAVTYSSWRATSVNSSGLFTFSSVNALGMINWSQPLSGHGIGQPPSLRGPSPRLSPEERVRRRALAVTGVFDNEGIDASLAQTNTTSTHTPVDRETALSIFNSVWDAANTLINMNEICRKALEGHYGTSQTLRDAKTRTNVFENIRSYLAGGGEAGAETSLATGTITLFAAFFASDVNFRIGNISANDLNLSPSDRRLLLYLHEISHSTGRATHASGRRGYREVFTQERLNEHIYENCFLSGRN